jgi:hypothetical protein
MRAHDLSGLAIAALRHLFVDPCLLHDGKPVCSGQALDRHHVAFHHADRECTGSHRRAVDQHGAGAAGGDAAAEFGARDTGEVAQRPQQRHIRVGVDVDRVSVDG